MYVCICKSVSEADIQEAVSQGASCMPHLKSKLKCSTQCGKCTDRAQQCLNNELAKQVSVSQQDVA